MSRLDCRSYSVRDPVSVVWLSCLHQTHLIAGACNLIIRSRRYSYIVHVLFCFLAVLDPRVGHTMDVLSPFIPVLCHSD